MTSNAGITARLPGDFAKGVRAERVSLSWQEGVFRGARLRRVGPVGFWRGYVVPAAGSGF